MLKKLSVASLIVMATALAPQAYSNASSFISGTQDPYNSNWRGAVDRANLVKNSTACSVVLSGTIHKGTRVQISNVTYGRGGLLERFYVPQWKQYLYADSFDVNSIECK